MNTSFYIKNTVKLNTKKRHLFDIFLPIPAMMVILDAYSLLVHFVLWSAIIVLETTTHLNNSSLYASRIFSFDFNQFYLIFLKYSVFLIKVII